MERITQMAKNKKEATSGEVAIEKVETGIIVAENKEVIKTDVEIDIYLATRQAFIQKVNAICVEGKDYHVIQGKKSLAKGGSEKIASIFKWTAKFEKDTEALEMLGAPVGLVAFKCTLMNGQFVGEGRGAASLQKNDGDPNKTLKMAQKSAFIDAVLRSSGLSDFFTQDLEDMPTQDLRPAPTTPAKYHTPVGSGNMATDKQLALMVDLLRRKNIKSIDLPVKFPWYKQGCISAKTVTKDQASEMLEWLFSYVPGHDVKDELPTIEQGQDLSPEDQTLVDSVPF
jgi:hypothetical protein